jgi:hypothetical protein
LAFARAVHQYASRMDPTGSQEQLTRRDTVSLYEFSAKFNHPATNV